MIARSLLALILCPTLGAVSGSWLFTHALTLVESIGFGDSVARMRGLGEVTYGALGGLALGVVFGLVLMWCFARGPGSPQRALGDLIVIALAVVGLLDAFFLVETSWAWPATAIIWLLGFLLALIGLGRHLLRRPAPDDIPYLDEDEVL